MSLLNPEVNEPLDRMADVFPEGTPFILDGIRIVPVTTSSYGKGEMVICKVRDRPRELSTWGSYLLAQARAVEPSDLGRTYTIKRQLVPGFGRSNNLVKTLVLVS